MEAAGTADRDVPAGGPAVPDPAVPVQAPVGAVPPEPDLSVVVPVRDERENLPVLYEEIVSALRGVRGTHEIVFVDDGSVDGSDGIVIGFAYANPNVRAIQLRRNFGQTAAIAAGFAHARGEVVVTMDADLQNDPADIPRLLAKLQEGYDIVSGWRRDRKDGFLLRRLPSVVANRFINKLIHGTGVRLHDYGCTLKAYRRHVVRRLRLYGEMHRFIPAFAAWMGIRVAEIPVHHRPRTRGASKYGISRLPRVLLDFVTLRFFCDYLTRPIQFFGKIAFAAVASGLALSLLLGVVGGRLGWGVDLNTYLMVNLLTCLLGGQFVTLGLLAEIMVRAYHESQRKEIYVVERCVPPMPAPESPASRTPACAASPVSWI